MAVGTRQGIAEARERARALRLEAFQAGEVPESRSEAMARAKAARKRADVTFRDVAERLIKARAPGWKDGGKSARQWRSSLEAYVFPTIGDAAPSDVTTEDALAILEPIWTTKPETARRIRSRCEAVLASARVLGLDTDRQNPFALKHHLELLLPKMSKVHAVRHHLAMAFRDEPVFWVELQDRPGMAARALEYVVLTAARSGEVRGARWREIDLEARLWTIPATRIRGAAASIRCRSLTPPWPSCRRCCRRSLTPMRSCSPDIVSAC